MTVFNGLLANIFRRYVNVLGRRGRRKLTFRLPEPRRTFSKGGEHKRGNLYPPKAPVRYCQRASGIRWTYAASCPRRAYPLEDRSGSDKARSFRTARGSARSRKGRISRGNSNSERARLGWRVLGVKFPPERIRL